MATSGNKTWVVASSKNIFGVTRTTSVKFSWERTAYSVEDNTSTISWVVEGITSNTEAQFNGFEISINYKVYRTLSVIEVPQNGTTTILSGTSVIPHSADGTKTFIVSFSANGTEYSESFTLDAIPAMARITSVTNFTDEENPTITYSNPGGTSVDSLQACISFTGGTDDISYRDIPKTGTSYTFNLTASERSVFWQKLDEGVTSTTVRVYIKTIINGEDLREYKNATLTFVNYKPFLTPTVEDINSSTLALTGNKNTLVRYMSVAYCQSQAVARKGAYLETDTVRNGDVYADFSGMIENVRSNTFYFEAIDNRGHTTNDAVVFNGLNNRNWIEYVKPTCSFNPGSIDANGNLSVTIKGKYWGGNFGAASNRFILEYDISPVDGFSSGFVYFGEDGVVTPTVDDDDNYTYTFTISGLEYNSGYNLIIRVSDELATATTISKVVVSANTLFDWGQSDFAFNIPVNMNRGYMYPQTILWSGQLQMDENDTITLDKPISEQPSGIVLVFSLFRDGAVEDKSIHTFFISRVETQYLFTDEPCPRTFLLGINSNLSVFGSKYIYISDTQLTGFEGNTNSGTAASGITFNNSQFVLRYVIGV